MSNNEYNNSKTECVSISRNVGQKLTFLVIGGGIGAALALLFAPKSGSELRSDIAAMAEDRYRETLTAANQLKETSSKYLSAVKETGSEVGDIVAAGAAALKSEVKTDVDRIGAIVEDTARRTVSSAKSMNIG